ncbi:MAG: carotenoid 1,2-hydratase [Deltaproteobacteria bacterium]|nr:carotenoid 1,2-hydratase [Deltaproteobacteria bacterium]
MTQVCRRGFALLCADLVGAGPSPAGSPERWTMVVGPRAWAFPRDHGSHPEYRTEWWYFTGILRGPGGERFGYELTFFRQGLVGRPRDPKNPWSVRDAHLAHFAVTDAVRGTFRFAERVSREGPGLAAAGREGLDVRVLNWSARQDRDGIALRARTSEMEIELQLHPRKRPVLHGEAGLSRKGSEPGQASYYVSLTDLETRGFLRPGPGQARRAVSGRSWFDHEFGSNQLSAAQEGWDWFGLHLEDGRDVMLYLLRRQGGGLEPASSGTLVEPDGTARHLRLEDVRLERLSSWKSPKSGATYPSRWRLSIPSARVEVVLAPLVSDQELATRSSTGVVYWEGAVAGAGSSEGRAVACEGYVELTGYAHGMGGTF